jgi:hypothetical protein
LEAQCSTIGNFKEQTNYVEREEGAIQVSGTGIEDIKIIHANM